MSTITTERAASFVDHAQRLATLRWALIRVDGKKPHDSEWQKTKPEEPGFAAGRWSHWGDRFNMGCVLGPSKLAVFEYDSDEARGRFFELLGGRVPNTPACRTGSGRAHVYFADADGVAPSSRDGLELRAGGQHVLVPPSIHPDTGKAYTWVSGHEPWSVQLLPLPSDVLAFFAAHRKGNPAPPIGERIPAGARNKTLASLAGTMRRRGASEREILAAIKVANEERCQPPLDEDELEEIAHSIARYPAGGNATAASGRVVEELSPRSELEVDGSGAPDHEPPQVETRPDVYEPLGLDSFLASPPAEPNWDWRGWHARGDVVLEAGDPGIGKSLSAQVRAVTAATGGGEHLGEAVAARRVVFFDLESPEDVVYSRLWGLDVRGNVEGLAYVHRPAGFDLLDPARLARFRETLVSERAELCVVDSLRRAAPGLDENDSRQVSTLFTALREIAAELAVTIIVVHHPRKPVGDAKIEALYAARGSGDLIGSVDSYVFYRRLAGGLVRVEHGKARRGREHAHVHFRIVEDEDSGGPTIEHVTVDEGQSDEALDAAVLAFVNEHPGKPTGKVEDGVKGGREAVRRALERLSAPGESQSVAAGPGRHPRGKYWFPLNHAALDSPGESRASLGDMSPGLPQGHVSPDSPAPRRGGEARGDTYGQQRIKGEHGRGDGLAESPLTAVSETNAGDPDTPRADSLEELVERVL